MEAIGMGVGLALLTLLGLLPLQAYVHLRTLYALLLAGIGFIYVGFMLGHLPSLVMAGVQATVFAVLAYAGLRVNLGYLIAGYFLHGAWDLGHHLLPALDASHTPHGYDLFCITYDWVVALYILVARRHFSCS